MAARRHGESVPLPELQRRHQADCQAWVGTVRRLWSPLFAGKRANCGANITGGLTILKADFVEHPNSMVSTISPKIRMDCPPFKLKKLVLSSSYLSSNQVVPFAIT